MHLLALESGYAMESEARAAQHAAQKQQAEPAVRMMAQV
jgi:hypothetical protein